MIITPLGHTEFLVDIDNNQGANVRILIDSWLSDYAVGDLMERTVKVRLDKEKIKTLDAIYISHAHSDHFDPYTLVEIFGNPLGKGGEGGFVSLDSRQNPQSSASPQTAPLQRSSQIPLLILPFTLRYLKGVIHEYLPQVEIHWLGNREIFHFQGIEIAGYMWSNPEITNEDDVMMIAISNDRELLFAEIDTIPDPYDEEVQKSLYKVFTRKKYETTCYLASRNCLEGQIPYYDVSVSKRKAFREKYIADQKEDILASYEKYDYEEYAHFPNLFTLPGFVRGYIGQGIAYPSSLSDELYTLSIFPLDEIVSIESDYAKNAGYEFSQKVILPGRQYKIENGSIEQGRKECPIGEIMKSEEGKVKNNDSVISSKESSRHSDEGRIHISETPGSFVPQDDGTRNQERLYASGPLFPREITGEDVEVGKKKILDILNTRFLPYWSGSPVASLRDVLIKNNGIYRIEFRDSVMSTESPVPVVMTRHLAQDMNEQDFSLGSKGQIHKTIFEYSTARTGFVEVPYEENMKIDEDYWFSDILDFLEGRQEMYSSFWHRLDPKRGYRLWTCLGATYMNHDLNIAKYRLHFGRAKNGETANDFVENVLNNINFW